MIHTPTGFYTYRRSESEFAAWTKRKDLAGNYEGEGYYYVDLVKRTVTRSDGAPLQNAAIPLERQESA